MKPVLTTTQAAEMAAVAPSTLKRWADQGRLEFSRTAGGHRRFERLAIEQLLRGQSGVAGEGPLGGWIGCLIGGQRHQVDGRLLEARWRLGSWSGVADELGAALTELGTRWECGALTIGEEHLASECLSRALARIGDALPTGRDGPSCLLACAGDDEHTLGLALAELTLRELGWNARWLGRRTPPAEIVRLVTRSEVAMVVLSASAASRDAKGLGKVARAIGPVCAERGVRLVLGGAGAWPARLAHAVRLNSFAAFRDYLLAQADAAHNGSTRRVAGRSAWGLPPRAARRLTAAQPARAR